MVYLILADGFEEIEALAPVDFLRRAGIPVKVLGLNALQVCGAHGVSVAADALISDVDFSDADAVILPGGMPGTKNLDSDPRLDGILALVDKRNGILAAICAAPMVLGKRGYLKEKRAICYPGFESDLIGASVVSDPVVQDGRVITARSAGHAWEFAYTVACALSDRSVCERVRESLFLPPFGA